MSAIKTLWQWLQGTPTTEKPPQAGDTELPRQLDAQLPAPAKEISARVREERRREARHAEYRAGPWQQK